MEEVGVVWWVADGIGTKYVLKLGEDVGIGELADCLNIDEFHFYGSESV